MVNEEKQNWGIVDDENQETKSVSSRPIYESDQHFYRVIVWGLTITVFCGMMGSLYLAVIGKEIPEAVVALGSTAVGALSGVLAATTRR